MHIRFSDKTLKAEINRQPGTPNEELAKQCGVPEKRIMKLRRRIFSRRCYFIRDNDRVKIGQSENPEDRLKRLQAQSKTKLILLGVCKDEEIELHSRFAHLKIRGEWFLLTDEIQNWVNENTT